MSFNKILTAIIVIVIIVLGFSYLKTHKVKVPSPTPSADTTQATPNPTPMPTTPTPTPSTSMSSGSIAVIDTNMGSFEVTLDAKSAPLTVANFIKLANDGYCNNTKFHRILQDFVIQGCDPNTISGDPSTWGQGGPGYTVPAEIGLKANIGAIGMASTQAKGPSSGSQFFVVTTESANNHAALDGNYTFFGYVTKGMDVVTKIAAVPVQPNLYGEPSLPVNPVVINKITIK